MGTDSNGIGPTQEVSDLPINGVKRMSGEVSLLRRPVSPPVSPGPTKRPPDVPLHEMPPLAAQASAAPSQKDEILACFDATLVDAFARSAKDRAMLMRADTEMEVFIRDTTLDRLPIQPPHFAPVNSYQRLLIHRLADSYGLVRVLEPATAPPGGHINILVLRKTSQSQLPATRLFDLERHLNALSRRAEPSAPTPVPQPAQLPIQVPVAEVEPPMVEEAEHVEVIVEPTPLPPANFRIMTRQPGSEPGRPRSSQSAEESGAIRRPLTLEEREAAYAEARQRIFASSSDGEMERPLSSAEGLTTASCPETPLMRPKALRPSAPAFDPTVFSPVASTSRLPAKDDDQESTTSSAPLDGWHLNNNSPGSSRHHRSGSRSPSSASVSTIASSKTSTSTSSSVSDSVSRTSRSTSSRRISAQQPVLRFGAGTAAPPLFPPHHPQRPASPSPSTASVSTNSSRRSAGGRSIKLGPGLPDLEPMAGRGARRHKIRTRTPSPPPNRPQHASLPEKPIWADKSKRVPEEHQQQQLPSPLVAVQPLPPDPRLYQPAFFTQPYADATPHAYYAPAMMPAGYYAVPVDGQGAPLWDALAMAALYQQQQQQQHIESMMGQMHLAAAAGSNGDVPIIQLDEDSPRAARPPSMALFDPTAETALRRTASNGRRPV